MENNDFLDETRRAMASINIPSIQVRDLEADWKKENPAKWTYERLTEYIKDFENDLDEEHEVGTCLVSFGSTMIFRFNFIGYYGPDIISFEGFDSHGHAVQLIQNVSQLNVLLIAVQKQGEKPVRIGFVPEGINPLPK